MRSWVHSLQRSLDNPPFNLTITDDAKIREHAANNFTMMQEFLLARQLLCSRGQKFDCSAKVQLYLVSGSHAGFIKGVKRKFMMEFQHLYIVARRRRAKFNNLIIIKEHRYFSVLGLQ